VISFDKSVDDDGVVNKICGPRGVEAWSTLMKNMGQLAAAVDALLTAALRGDGTVVAATDAPYLPNFGKLNPLNNLKLMKPFQSVLTNSNINKNNKGDESESSSTSFVQN